MTSATGGERAQEILLVDDERLLRENMRRTLESAGYAVRTAKNGDEALAAVEMKRPDLVLLDCNMPKRGGISTCEELRARDPLLPIVFLTAYFSDTRQVSGYNAGADGYFSKTADESVILSAIKSVLKRVDAQKRAADAPRRRILDGIEIDFDALTVRGPEVDEHLTKTEADFLWLLAFARDRVFGYDEIFEVLRGPDFIGDDRTLQVHVRHLRQKLGPAGGRIVNVRGVGYKLV